jgi:cytochrome c-type biogenesis protein CcmH/NrfG
LASLPILLLLLCPAQSVDKARELYQHTDYDGALAQLSPINNKDAETWRLTGEALFHKGEYKRAAEALEKAAALDPKSSQVAHALGRAYGRQAENANPIMAPRYAVKTRQAFEKAVALDASNKEALNDLLEYYLEAPGFLGGGLSRAEELQPRIARQDESEGHFARAQIALKRKDHATAERELRAAMAASPKQPGRILDLAKLVATQGRISESDRLYEQALKLAPASPQVLYAVAEAYIRRNHELPQAAAYLEKFLSLPLTPDDPPRHKAVELLNQARPRNGQSH